MEKYIGTKIVKAEPAYKMKGSDNLILSEADWRKSRAPGELGYRVIYSDGYVSWSPKDVFEAAYRETSGMNFGLAIEAVKTGKKAKRRGWNGKNQHIELATAISYKTVEGAFVNVNHDAIGNKAIAFCGTSGVQMGWLASQADMLADDWEIVD